MADFIPTVKARRGKGPRTKKQMKARRRRVEADAKLDFPQPEERKNKQYRLENE